MLSVSSPIREGLARRESGASVTENLGVHEVFTVSYKGWAGLKNGELLQRAENDSIEVFLTGDQTLTYEQTSPDGPSRS